MACPFFYPVERFRDGAWAKPPRLPLGDPCRGECRVNPESPFQPGIDELRDYCNLGYARGRCAQFPDRDDVADAIRFSIVHDRSGSIELLYILEQDYGPLRHGPLTYDLGAADFTTPPQETALAAQARQFIASYLNRRMKA